MRCSVSTVPANFLVREAHYTLPQVARSNDAALKIVAFGAYLTARRRWTQSLETALGRCHGRPVAVAIVAKSGATSDWGASTVDWEVAKSPDIGLIEFSANDAALPRLSAYAAARKTWRG
jgi:acyl-CoA thioesterase-1